MGNGRFSGVTNGKQMSLDQLEAKNTSEGNEKNTKEFLDYIRNELPKTSPIHIPENAIIKPESKARGYFQIKYEWESNGYKYISRWHTHTPNAPDYSRNTWVVERKRPGIGYGKDHRPRIHEVLIGKNKWIDWDIWHEAIKSRKKGKETKEQREMLDNGHWKA